MKPPDTIVNKWNDTILLSLEIGTNTAALQLGPPMVARLVAMTYSAAFQAWAPYSDTATALLPGGPPRRPAGQRTLANKNIAISYAIYRVTTALFADVRIRALLDAQMAELGLSVTDNTTAGNSPVAIGNSAAQMVLASRTADNSNQAGTMPGSTTPGKPYGDFTGYVPVNPPALAFGDTHRRHVVDPGRWQPLSYINPNDGTVATPGFIAPHWGQVTPFALTSGDQFRPSPPEPFTSQAFLDQARFVIDIQQRLTTEQKIIAEFWADGPKSWLPPGHWCEVAGLVSRERFHTVDQDVKLFFALSNAILDASIATWDAKRHYDYVRPITAIRWLYDQFGFAGFSGNGFGAVEGERWRPFQKDTFPTPPFPEYSSGHSAFSMAAAVVLKRATGSDMFTLRHTQEVPLAAQPDIAGLPVTITWNSFSEAAFSAGESRLFGGIHFYQGNVAGLELGRKVGEAAWTKALSFF
ncbi:MAG: vanadium-dependent haloperoxidase [Gemmatimonadaceae bacterium]|nr:vanadium-dependent haloperoxidase [Gemmatimonadaceae bacterium]